MSAAVLVPFGKFKGKLVADVPDDDLRWLGSLDLKSAAFRVAVADELGRRRLTPKEPKPRAGPPPPAASGDGLAPVRDALEAVERARVALGKFLEREGRR